MDIWVLFVAIPPSIEPSAREFHKTSSFDNHQINNRWVDILHQRELKSKAKLKKIREEKKALEEKKKVGRERSKSGK